MQNKNDMKFFRIIFFAVLLQVPSTDVIAQSDTIRLSMQQIFDIADNKSHSIREAEYLIDNALHELEHIKMQFTPDINITATAGYQGNATIMNRNFTNSESVVLPHFSNNLSLQINQPILDMALNKEKELHKSTYKVREVQLQIKKQDIRFMLADWLLQYMKYMNMNGILEKDRARIQKLLQETSYRYEQGTALRSDVTYYKLELQKRELAIIKNNNLLEILNFQFTRILDLPEDTVVIPYEEIPSPQKLKEINSHPAYSLSYIESINQYNESLANEAFVKSVKWPQLSGWFENNLTGPLSSSTPPLNKNINNWGVGIRLSYNIGNLYKYKSKIKSAKSFSKSMAEHSELVYRKNETELFTVKTKLKELLEEFDIRTEQIRLAEDLYNLTYERYSGGTAILTEMLDARNNLLQANIEYLDVQIEAYYQYCIIKKIMGEL